MKNNGFLSETVSATEPVIERAAAVAHKAVDKAKDAAAPAANWLVERGESLNATQKKLTADACSYVSANPLKAVGIAAVTGFLLSRLFH